MFKIKGKISVKAATKKVFESMPNKFHSITLCDIIKHEVGRLMLMDGTILRRLRELRASGVLNYRVIDAEIGLCEKI